MSSFVDPPRGGKAVIRPPHLRLVHPAPPTPPRRRRGVAKPVEDVFTPAEVARLRLAFTNALDRFRTWERLAEAMGVHRDTVRGAGRYFTLTANTLTRMRCKAARASAARRTAGYAGTRSRIGSPGATYTCSSTFWRFACLE